MELKVALTFLLNKVSSCGPLTAMEATEVKTWWYGGRFRAPCTPLVSKRDTFPHRLLLSVLSIFKYQAILDINGLSKANINNKNSYMLYTRDIQYTNTVPLKKKVVQYLYS